AINIPLSTGKTMSDNVAHALSGAGGGIISMVLTYPLITVSSRLQVQKDNKSADAYKGGRDAIGKIVRKEGIGGLYSGLSSAIFGIAVSNGVYYYFYEWTKAFFEKSTPGQPISVKRSMIAGAIAGAATVLITNPIWVVNTRMTTRKDSLNDESTSESGENKMGSHPSGKALSQPWCCKLVATGSTYPYIVIKSRMQLRQSSKESARYKSVMDGLRKIIRSEGVGGLYKGITSKLLQSVLTAAFLFMYKEVLFKYSVAFLMLIGARQRITQ
ncbi:11428_t:CDS:2, partial [Acaulospora morrowiae]